MAFYVSHMTPHKRARIHMGDCGHCRNGQGQENQAKTGSGATGWSPPLQTVAEAEAYPWTAQERDEVARTRRVVSGAPATVRTRLEALAHEYGADEVMVLTIAPDYALRQRSYELLAEVFATTMARA